MATVFIIGDTHIPYVHESYLEWCIKQVETYKPDVIVHIGDEVDHHYLSYHEKQIENSGAGIEYKEAYQGLKPWMKAFPNMKICIGNHTALPNRKARSHSIPSVYLKSYRELWDAPEGWEWGFEFVIDNVLYTHKPGKGLKMALQNSLDARHRSCVFGHVHAHAGVYWAEKKGNEAIFAMNVGWGGDHEAWAFEYAKEYPDKGILGGGIVYDGQDAYFLKMLTK